MAESVDNEELTAFVSSTLQAISTGVKQAATACQRNASNGYTTFDMPNKVVFDVAVTAKRTSEGGKGLKVEVFSIGGDLSGKKSLHSETVSRITFEVPWSYTRTAPVQSEGRGDW